MASINCGHIVPIKLAKPCGVISDMKASKHPTGCAHQDWDRENHTPEHFRPDALIEDNALLVEGETNWVFVDAKTGRFAFNTQKCYNFS